MRLINEIGNRYGKLVVIKRMENKGTRATWLCQCDCGNKSTVMGTSLRCGNNISCGCSHKLPRGEAAFNSLVLRMKKNAKIRGYKWKLTKKEVKEIVDAPCSYCGLLPLNILKPKGSNGNYIYNGIDRIDNNKGYIQKNCISCCTECNKAKEKRTVSEFLDWFKRLILHNKWNYKNIDNIKFEVNL